MWCFHEHFCAQPQRVFDSLCDFMQVPAPERTGWNDPLSFFQRCYGSDEKPERQDGKLWCAARQQYVRGTGGNYDPLPEIDIRQALRDPWQFCHSSSDARRQGLACR